MPRNLSGRQGETALERATGITLESHHVVIDEASRGSVTRAPDPLPNPAR